MFKRKIGIHPKGEATMAKLTLPEQLEDWKVLSPVSENGNYPTFSVVKTDSNGSNTNAVLTYVSFEGDSYNSDNIDLVNEEAAFVKSVIKLRGTSNYLDAVADNDPANSRIKAIKEFSTLFMWLII